MICNSSCESPNNPTIDDKLHLVITKFMLVSQEWLSRGLKKENILSEANLAPRIENFEKYYIPWVMNQTNTNFFLFILIDKDLPEKFISQIKRIISVLDNVYIIKHDITRSLSLNYFLEQKYFDANSENNNFDKIKKRIGRDIEDCRKVENFEKFNYVITTRIDDDDVLSKYFINHIQSQCEDIEDMKIIGFNKGYFMTDKISHMDTGYKKGSHSIGLTLIQNIQNTNIKQLFNVYVTPHHDWEKSLNFISNNEKLLISKKNYNKEKYYFIDNSNKIYIYNRCLSTSVYVCDTEPITEKTINDFLYHFDYHNAVMSLMPH